MNNKPLSNIIASDNENESNALMLRGNKKGDVPSYIAASIATS